MNSITTEVKLIVLTCGVCHIKHAIPEDLHDDAQDKNQHWFCPKGHSLVFTKSEHTKKLESLEAELAEKDRGLQYLKDQRNRALREAKSQDYQKRAAKAKLTRQTKRISKGVCPCCTRTFQNLQRHMKTQHPKYIEKDQT